MNVTDISMLGLITAIATAEMLARLDEYEAGTRAITKDEVLRDLRAMTNASLALNEALINMVEGKVK